MKNIIIFGTTIFTKMLRSYVEQYTNDKVMAFSVEQEYLSEKTFDGLDVIAFEEIPLLCNTNNIAVLIGTGYKLMNGVRKRIFELCEENNLPIYDFIHPTADIIGKVIGKGNIILDNSYIGLNSFIGDGNIICNGCNISHDNKIGNFNYFAPGVITAGCINISDNCFLGLNCAVKDCVQIADYTLVGAGAYMAKDSKPYDVIVPTRSIVLDNKKSTDLI